jgi:hypothetical protein
LREGVAERHGDEADVADDDVVGSEGWAGVAGDFQFVLAVAQGLGRKLEEEDGVFFILKERREFFVIEADVPGLFHIALAEAEGLLGFVFGGGEFENQLFAFGGVGEFIPFHFLAGAEVVPLGIEHLGKAASRLNRKEGDQNAADVMPRSHSDSVTSFEGRRREGEGGARYEFFMEQQ